MTFHTIREYCLKKPGTTESMPFGPETLLIKVGSKMFILLPVNANRLTINLKCDPILAMDLREMYRGKVIPGYHMNKLHWNTVAIDGSIPDEEIYKMIDHSYDLVFNKLTRLEREKISPR